MSDIKVCRICLCKGVKVYNYDSFHLKQYYEEIMARKVNEKDGLPNYFCYECAAMLYKFHKFKEKCCMGEKALKELLWGGSITLSSISQIDRQDNKLKSPINIITVSNRVRTYRIKNKTLSESLVNEIKKNEIPEIEEYIVEYDSDDSSDDKNLTEVKNEMTNEKTKSIVDDKTNIENGISAEEKARPELEDDRMFSNDDGDSNSENVNDIDKPVIKEEITIEEEKINFNTEQANSDEEIVLHKNNKDIDKPVIQDEITIEEEKTNFNTEQANSNGEIVLHKNNKDIDKPVIQDEITIEEEKINFNTEQANSNGEIVLHKNHNEKKRKKNQTKTDFPDTKAKKFEVFNTKKNYLDPNHWLKFNLTEEEALEEFRARAQDRKYVSAAYKCSKCYKWFSKEDMLHRHIKLRHSESLGPVECRFCKMRFKIKCQLTAHITQHYTKYKCLRCDLVCPLKSTALFHNDYHNGVIRKCIHCGVEFRHLSTYYTHLRTHRSEYVCTLCGASFVSTKGLNKHKGTMHINTVVNPEEGVTHTDTYCDRCDIKFETRKAYQEHVFHSAKHTEGVEDMAWEIPAPSIPQRGRKCLLKNPRNFTPCTLCNRNFSNRKAYRKHHKEEHKDEPLPSKEEQRYICEICGASLGGNSVATHLNTHTREKMYNCSTCHMQFNSKSSMTRHQLTHTSEKPVACTLCDKRFKQSSSMKLHYRTFHLKEPYPKRNRKKKNDDLSKDEYGHEDSDDNMTLDKFCTRKY